MSRNCKWNIYEALPKRVSVGDYLLALHLVREKAMTWPYITQYYPRTLTEMISDRGRLWWTRFSRWRRTTPRRATRYSNGWILTAVILWVVFLCLVGFSHLPKDLTVLMKMVDSGAW